jgi:hypothetical protein
MRYILRKEEANVSETSVTKTKLCGVTSQKTEIFLRTATMASNCSFMFLIMSALMKKIIILKIIRSNNIRFCDVIKACVRVEKLPYSFSAATLQESEWSASRPGRFTLGRTPQYS